MTIELRRRSLTKAAADGAYLPVPGTTPTAGQLIASDGAGGTTPVNPTGQSLLAYAENNTATSQTGLTGSAVDITGCSISIPASTRPVLPWAHFAAFATVAPTNGAAGLNIVEVSNGVDTPVTMAAFGPPISVINKVSTISLPPTQLAASTARTRTLKPQWAGTGTGTWTVDNGANNRRSVMGAWAG